MLLLIIIGLSIGYQIRIGNDFRKDFVSQKDFYTQLNWRVPSLKPGAMIYSPTTPFSKEADYSVSMGVNLLFNSNDITPELGYWFSTPRYFKPEELLADPNQSVTGGLRNLTFSGTANKTISLIKPVGGCLLILDPYYVLIPQKMDALDYTFTTGEIDQFLLYGSITNQSLIDDTIRPTNNLSKIVDTSPMENWCFYFEKADLAQSKGRMQEAVDLYTEALAKHLKTNQSYEYLPFIKAYASLGQVDEAIALTKQSFKMGSLSRPPICQLWHDLIADNPLINKYSIDEVYNSTNCYGLAK